MTAPWTFQIDLARPWLSVVLPERLRCLSWAPHGGGTRMADRVLWREVRDADLSAEFDAEGWLAAQMAERGAQAAVGLLTSRNVAHFRLAETQVLAETRAVCCATVGLGNAERVGVRRAQGTAWGTVNIVCATDAALTQSAQVEALSVAVQARTAAILDTGVRLETGWATGTGTDCLVLACRPGAEPYAGTHTAVGEAVGCAVYEAVLAGAQEWCVTEGADQRRE